MKTIGILFHFILFTSSVYSANTFVGIKNKLNLFKHNTVDSIAHVNDLFIIPLSTESLVCKMEENQVKVLSKIPITNASKAIIVNDEYVCSIDSMVSIFDLKGKCLHTFTGDFTPISLNAKNRVIYLGGKYSVEAKKPGEIFAIIDLEKSWPKLTSIILPIKIRPFKSIDDVLILGNKLILVDNVIYPKYLFEYDITDSKKPVHLSTKKLENHMPNEHIVKGDVNQNWLILFSQGTFRSGTSKYIAIQGKSSGKLYVHLPSYFSKEWDTQQKPKYNYRDICLIDSNLFILTWDLLYRLDLNGTISEEQLVEIKTSILEIEMVLKTPTNRLIAVSENEYELIH
jgi:hypothetical protein